VALGSQRLYTHRAETVHAAFGFNDMNASPPDQRRIAPWPQTVLSALAPNRPVFHSEADFQHAFAWQVHLDDPEAVIRLETRPDPEVRETVDFWCHTRSQRIAVEFKYLVRRFEATVDGEQFRLRDQGVQPLSRYDILKDISRLERFCAAGWAEVGFAVVLSNDPAGLVAGPIGLDR